MLTVVPLYCEVKSGFLSDVVGRYVGGSDLAHCWHTSTNDERPRTNRSFRSCRCVVSDLVGTAGSLRSGARPPPARPHTRGRSPRFVTTRYVSSTLRVAPSMPQVGQQVHQRPPDPHARSRMGRIRQLVAFTRRDGCRLSHRGWGDTAGWSVLVRHRLPYPRTLRRRTPRASRDARGWECDSANRCASLNAPLTAACRHPPPCPRRTHPRTTLTS